MCCGVRCAVFMMLALVWLLWSATAVGLHGNSHQSGKTVHVVFSNHLDIGFDGIDPELGTDDAVINKYFDVYFPRVVRRWCLRSRCCLKFSGGPRPALRI